MLGGGGRRYAAKLLTMFSQLLQLCTVHSAQLNSIGYTVHMGWGRLRLNNVTQQDIPYLN